MINKCPITAGTKDGIFIISKVNYTTKHSSKILAICELTNNRVVLGFFDI